MGDENNAELNAQNDSLDAPREFSEPTERINVLNEDNIKMDAVFSPPVAVADGAQVEEHSSRSSKRFSTRLDAKSLSESIQALEQGSVTNAESDTIINMSKQLSHMAQEIESLKIQVFQTSEALKNKEMLLHQQRMRNFLASPLFKGFMMNHDDRKHCFLVWKEQTIKEKNEQVDTKNFLRDHVGDQLLKAEKHNLKEALRENAMLQRNLLFAKIFYRWRMNVERTMTDEKERRWAAERKVVREHLKQLTRSCISANEMEASYLKAALGRGDEVLLSIDSICGAILTRPETCSESTGDVKAEKFTP